jgi:zinc protease
MLKSFGHLTFALVGVLAFAGACPAAPQALPQGVTAVRSVEGIDEYRLGNGLQVLLVPDDSKPTTTVNLTVHVGSRMENYGETGMAHLLEHMLFKGSPRHPQPWAEFERRGLDANGSTSFDRTNYHARFSANPDNLKWYIDWLADALVNSNVSRKDLDSEMTVVRNEMESGENDPERVLLQETMSVMFDWHAYAKEPIGARADVENVDIPRLQAFYHLYYQPDNATLIVSGRFDATAVLQEIAGSFGKLAKPTRKLPVLYTLDPAQDGERSVTVRRVGGAPLVYASYHAPAGPAPDFAAMEVLSIILGDAPSGRLHKRLTEQGLASGTFAFAMGLADPGVFVTGAQLAPGQDVDKARAALLAVDESIAKEPITAEELARAKAKYAKSWEQRFTNPETIGVALSESIAQGDWRLFFLRRDRVRDITLADVQRVATAYLVPTDRTLATYLPTDTVVRAPAPQRVDVAAAMKDFKPQVAAAQVEAFDASPANLDQRTQRFEVGGIRAAVLPKGTRGNAVHATLTLRFGDEQGLFGWNDVPEAVASMLDKGSTTMTREQIQDRLDQLRTEMSIGSGPGRVTVSLTSRREYLPDAIALVADLLRHPAFPEPALAELKQEAVTEIEQQRREPDALAQNTLERWSNPYPRGDVRYAPTFDEMVADTQALTTARLRDFHARFYGARQGEFAAVGDFDVGAVRGALERGFADWQGAGAAFTRVPHPLVALKPGLMTLETPDKQNATLLVRENLAISDREADFPALMMANYLLGGSNTSRLWKRVRETEGLSYDVRTGIMWNNFEANSALHGSAIYAPQVRAKVETAFREEIARALKDGFTGQELAEGQRGLLNFRRLSRAQDATLASQLATNTYLGRTFEFAARIDAGLQALTVAQVNAALRRYVKPDDFVFAFAGDFQAPAKSAPRQP